MTITIPLWHVNDRESLSCILNGRIYSSELDALANTLINPFVSLSKLSTIPFLWTPDCVTTLHLFIFIDNQAFRGQSSLSINWRIFEGSRVFFNFFTNSNGFSFIVDVSDIEFTISFESSFLLILLLLLLLPNTFSSIISVTISLHKFWLKSLFWLNFISFLWNISSKPILRRL